VQKYQSETAGQRANGPRFSRRAASASERSGRLEALVRPRSWFEDQVDTITEIIVPITTTQRISTFKSKATSALLASSKWDKSQWTFKAKRIVTVKSKPTKEHNTPPMTLLKAGEARKRSK
jgi:hypothetical protein